MGKSSREKGKVGERKACIEMKQLGVLLTRRVRNREGEDDLIGLPGVSFECKLEKRTNIGAAIRQAIEQAGDDVPAVLHRQACRGEQGNPWCLTIRIQDTPRLMECLCAATQSSASCAAPTSQPD